MNYRLLLLAVLAFLGSLLPSQAAAQKPTPAPPPTPPSSTSSGGASSNPFPTNMQPVQPDTDLVLFVHGHVASNDATALPQNVSLEVVCNEKVRKQAYAAPDGDFNLQFGTPTGSFVDASDDSSSSRGIPSNPSLAGISPRELSQCELRASAAGFLTNNLSLIGITPSSTRTVDLGNVVIERLNKPKGGTVSAAPYLTSPPARKAYEKGLAAQKNGKLDEARKYFEEAVNRDPRYASAWFRLGTVLEKQKETDSAHSAYTKSTLIDTRFLPPYLSLASMAYSAHDWAAVLQYTTHVFAVDPLDYGGNTFVVDLDDYNPADAYFYNAVANYNLNHLEDAEKSGMHAERLNLPDHELQLHLLLAQVFTRKQHYSQAIAELQTYLQLVPHATNGDLIRAQIAKLEQLSRSAAASQQNIQN